MSVHDGHRKRMKDRYRATGFVGMSDHEIMEMLLYYVIPRRNTNEEAHRLVKRFGSIANVLNASDMELRSLDGIGSETALYLRMLGDIFKHMQVKKSKELKYLRKTEDYIEYMRGYFVGQRNEVVYLLCLDAKSSVLDCCKIAEGGVNSVEISVRKAVEYAMVCGASTVVLAHNHPGGLVKPSEADMMITLQIGYAMREMDIILIDHLIFSEDAHLSMEYAGYYKSGDIYDVSQIFNKLSRR